MDHAARAGVTVASWNINAVRGASPAKLADVASALAKHKPDLLLLQEAMCSVASGNSCKPGTAPIGLDHVHFSGFPARRERSTATRHTGMIASRWNLQPRAWPVKTEWPQLIVAAEVDTPLGELLIVGTHIPNGTGNGMQKVYSLEALTAGLTPSRIPVVLAGDFNEPRTFTPCDLMSIPAPYYRGATEGTFTDLHGITHERLRWQRAVEAALAAGDERNAWGGHHVVTQVGIEFEATHLAADDPPHVHHPHHTTASGPLGDHHTARHPPDRISDRSSSPQRSSEHCHVRPGAPPAPVAYLKSSARPTAPWTTREHAAICTARADPIAGQVSPRRPPGGQFGDITVDRAQRAIASIRMQPDIASDQRDSSWRRRRDLNPRTP